MTLPSVMPLVWLKSVQSVSEFCKCLTRQGLLIKRVEETIVRNNDSIKTDEIISPQNPPSDATSARWQHWYVKCFCVPSHRGRKWRRVVHLYIQSLVFTYFNQYQAIEHLLTTTWSRISRICFCFLYFYHLFWNLQLNGGSCSPSQKRSQGNQWKNLVVLLASYVCLCSECC